MTQLLGPDTFEFFARYLLAGYVVIIVRSRFILGVRPKPAELVVEAVIFSLMIQMIWLSFAEVAELSGLMRWLAGISLDPPHQPEAYLLFRVLVLPTLFGALLGYNLTSGWKHALLRRLSMPVMHPAQRAHDFAFGASREPCLVIVTYEDGTRILGYFGVNSLASSDPQRSDLYLERLYLENEDGQWEEPKPTRSGLISLNGVRSIEFLNDEGQEDEQG